MENDKVKTYNFEHMFRPLTEKDITEYKEQIINLEEAFLQEVQRVKNKSLVEIQPEIESEMELF